MCSLLKQRTISLVTFQLITVNVVIYAWIHFHRFMRIGNFACIEIHVLSLIGSLGVHIFGDIKETRITQKYVQRENIYVHSKSFSQLQIITRYTVRH